MSGIAAIGAAAAVAGAAATAYGALKKGEGVSQNRAAQDAVTREQLQRQAEQDRAAYEISKWYNQQTGGLLDNTLANTQSTLAGGDGAAIQAARESSRAARERAGLDLISGAPGPTNYSDKAPDASGAVKSENARQLVKALDLGRARASAGANVNSWGDALLDVGIDTAHGTQAQQGINREQRAVDRTAMRRSKLNEDTHVPVLSAGDKYRMASGAGADAFNTGSLIQTGGNVISALGSNGTLGQIPGYFDGLFQGAVPTSPGVMGPQQPGIFSGIFT